MPTVRLDGLTYTGNTSMVRPASDTCYATVGTILKYLGVPSKLIGCVPKVADRYVRTVHKIITTRLEKKLDENQPREQAGFSIKYSTIDHIHAINQIKEKCREYNIPLCVASVDCEKAFDSVKTHAILTSLQEQGIEDVYIEILKDMYTDSSVTVHMHKESEKIRIKGVVRKGDTISPKLFAATLESIFRRLNWENKSVKIDGEFLSNLRFSDDIFLCTETPQ